MTKRLIYAVLLAILLAGCSNAVKSTLSAGYERTRPYALAVLPVEASPGVSLDDKAARILRNAAVDRLRSMDYLVVGPEEVDSKLSGQPAPATGAEAAAALGADAVVRVTITKWESRLLVGYASLAFSGRFRMYGRDGSVLWEAEHGGREADLRLDKSQLELSIIKAYEPALERFVDMVLFTLPKAVAPREPKRYFDWLP